MADIDIVPKHRSYTWLWIVIALVVLAIIWYAIARSGHPAAAGAVGSLFHPGDGAWASVGVFG